MSRSEIPELFRIGKRISVLPIIHGSGECALLVRRWMLENAFDVAAIPLPPSFRNSVEQAVLESKSYSDSEALKLNIIDLRAENLNDLLEQVHGRTVTLAGGTTVKLETKNAP